VNQDQLRDEIDAAIRRTAEAVSAELLQNITAQIGTSLKPVKALPPAWVLVTALVASVVGVAAAVAGILGLFGIRAMSIGAATAVFCLLGVLTILAAASCVQLGIPGSRNWVRPSVLLATEALALVALFATCFDNYSTEDFLAQGVRCLVAGLISAVPAALLVSRILRRCFPLDAGATMLACGTLAGLAGVIMLELHCARLQAPHLVVWHTAVLLVSAATGFAMTGAVFRVRRPLR
jgi:hypothetical protein